MGKRKSYDIELKKGYKLSKKNPNADLSGYKPWIIGGVILFLLLGGVFGGIQAVKYLRKEDFIKAMGAALKSMGFSNETILMIIAHAGVETAMGTRGEAVKGNNFWNISAGTKDKPSSDWKGPVILGGDKEPDGKGGWVGIIQRWRAWPSLTEAVKGYMSFLKGSRYQAQGVWDKLMAGDARGFVTALYKAGYYTWPVEDFVDVDGKAKSGYWAMFQGQYNLAKRVLGI